MTYTIATKRAYLRVTYAAKGASSLLDALVAKLTAAVNALETGQVISSTSSADVSVSFSDPDKTGIDANHFIEMWESLIGDYDYAVTLLNGEGITTPSDSQIYNKLLAVVLVSVKSFGGDFTQIRRECAVRNGMS